MTNFKQVTDSLLSFWEVNPKVLVLFYFAEPISFCLRHIRVNLHESGYSLHSVAGVIKTASLILGNCIDIYIWQGFEKSWCGTAWCGKGAKVTSCKVSFFQIIIIHLRIKFPVTFLLLRGTNMHEKCAWACTDLCFLHWTISFFVFFLYRICAEMAELSTSTREYEKAINFYKEGLTYDDTHIPVRVEKVICPGNTD